MRAVKNTAKSDFKMSIGVKREFKSKGGTVKSGGGGLPPVGLKRRA
jgi:hypothetical protein